MQEELLLEFIKRYCEDKKIEFKNNNEFINSILNYIYIREDNSIDFVYHDKSYQVYSSNLIKYTTNE
ncbi:MAG: hypothetical protein PHD20_05405 [Clostridia bacterium]|nr:hypothetical protein [Clostridia bacterium]